MRNGFPLFLISFLALFLELAFIRWIPANVLSLAYFSNIVLISSFLGLGVGCLLARFRDLFALFPVALLSAIAGLVAFRWFEVIVPLQSSEWIWSQYAGNELDPPALRIGILTTLVIVYLLNAVPFVIIGQQMGRRMEAFAPLRAYSLNIAGSLSGIVAFAALSLLGDAVNSPVVWFGVGAGARLDVPAVHDEG